MVLLLWKALCCAGWRLGMRNRLACGCHLRQSIALNWGGGLAYECEPEPAKFIRETIYVDILYIDRIRLHGLKIVGLMW